MMDYHLMYNALMDKTNAIFAENENIRRRIHKMIGYSPMQIVERKDERETIVRDTTKKFHVACRFLRDFIERNYVGRVKPFRSYTGIHLITVSLKWMILSLTAGDVCGNALRTYRLLIMTLK